MNKKERKYFERMTEYKKREIKTNSANSTAYLNYFSTMIPDTANYVLSERFSPDVGKREIINLLENIKKIEKGGEI